MEYIREMLENSATAINFFSHDALQSWLDAGSHCVNYCEQLPLHCVNLGFLAFLSLAFLQVTRLQFAPECALP